MARSAKTRLGALQVAVSTAALTFAAGLGAASAQEAPTGWEATPNIVPHDGLNPFAPPPAGVLDDGVIGIGQMITDAPPPGGSVGLCTGTLINPRVVLFAAHCVNSRPADAYGSAHGGVALSFGFNPNNLPAAINWISNGWATNTDLNIYNANQVWYHPGSLPTTFLEADIALATLDTPAFGIPTWTMLFSPLTQETHGVVIGYGATGSGSAGANLGIDFRRRAAENMISALVSFDDLDEHLFGVPPEGLPQVLYQLDFDDPLRADVHDFDLYDGDALPNESITAGGDSGGPLIADQAFDRPVVIATLSGGLRFFGAAQPFSSYGTASFYQPLFLYWDAIVQNNSYVYAESIPGFGSWTDPDHWIQAMDPNYAVVRDGELANDLPDTPAQGVADDTTHFGNICFLDDCVDVRQVGPGENSTGPGLVIPGGPGSTDFVPNNVDPDPALGVRARYYDVTLSAIGATWLDSSVTIDRFTLDGALTSLDVRNAGTLSVLGDFNVFAGILNVDGRINSGEALLVQGLLTGRGTFNPTFLTSVDGVIAPGSLLGVGTLSVQGDVILASENELLIELGRTTGDQLRVLADPTQGTLGDISLGGDLWLSPSFTPGDRPRHGNVYTIVLADGSVIDTFDDVNAFLGVLQPELTYLPNSVRVKLKAGSFANFITDNPALMPFALALDELRENHYDNLYNLYGEIDLMDPVRLSAAFSSLSPGSLMDAHGLMAMQQSAFGVTLQDRLSFIARTGGAPGALSVSGDPGRVLSFGGDPGLGAAGELSFASMLSETSHVTVLPGRMSAFISGGYGEARASSAAGRTAFTSDDGLRTWDMVGGVEHTMRDLTLGIAAGYSSGSAAQTTTAALAENELAQTAMYGVYRFDDGLYLSGMIGAGLSRSSIERSFVAGSLDYRMHGDVRGDLFLASMEGGVNIALSPSFTLTPNVSVRQYTLRMRGFDESGGETALSIGEQSYERAEARLGVRLAGDHVFDTGWRLLPSIDVAGVGNLAGDEKGVWARFAAAPDVPFYLPGATRDDFWGEILGGVKLVRGETSLALQVETSVGREEIHEDRYMARYAQRF
jgi:hypothetical protein